MKKIRVITTVVISFLAIQGFAQIPSWQWVKSIGSTGNEKGNGVATDASGNIFVTGSFEGSVDFDPGAGTHNLTCAGILDLYLLKLDSLGNFVWAISIGGTGSDVGYAVATDQGGNSYITGRFNGTVDFDPGAGVTTLSATGSFDAFVAKFDPAGNLVWAKAFSGQTDDEGFSIAVDAATNVYISGYFDTTCDFDPGPGTYPLVSNGGYDGFIVKLENTGDLLWAKSFGGILFDSALGISVDGNSNVYTTGHYNGNVDFDPGPGTYLLPIMGGDEIYVSKLTANGGFVWAKPLGGVQTDWAYAIVADDAGNTYSTGSFRGSADFDPGSGFLWLSASSNSYSECYTAKLDDAGNSSWAYATGGIKDDVGYSIALDSLGNVYVLGSFKETVDFDPGSGVNGITAIGQSDVFITKTDSTGNYQWTKTFGGTEFDTPYSIATDPAGHVVVTGAFSSYFITVDTFTVYNALPAAPTTGDIFIARLDLPNTTGLSSPVENNSWNIYPSPASDKLYVSIPEGMNETSRIEILDIAGKCVMSSIMPSAHRAVLNVSSLNSGVYFMRMQTDNGFESRKFVIGR